MKHYTVQNSWRAMLCSRALHAYAVHDPFSKFLVWFLNNAHRKKEAYKYSTRTSVVMSYERYLAGSIHYLH